jgi:mono/diheme cytochrome c family protein
MKPQQLAVLVVAATLGVLLLLLLLYGRPRRAEQEPLPANFHRGDPDQILEGPRLQRMQIWGVATSIFIAGLLAVLFVAEPFRESSKAKAMLNQSVERGAFIFSPDGDAKCSQCHGPKGEGGFAATDISWPAPPLNNELLRYSVTDVRRIIKGGRPGTPMPAWGLEFGGPLNDQKIDDVINYLQSIQVPADRKFELPDDLTDGRQVFTQKCAVCHGPEGRGQALGKPLPTFFAPDLTTEFYRLGVEVLRKSRPDFDPRRASAGEILAAGEQASRNTIINGRTNTPMPGWKERIGPKQIDAVVAYLKSIQRPST